MSDRSRRRPPIEAPMDAAKVRRLRRALAEGSLTIDADRIAHAITGAEPEPREPVRPGLASGRSSHDAGSHDSERPPKR